MSNPLRPALAMALSLAAVAGCTTLPNAQVSRANVSTTAAVTRTATVAPKTATAVAAPVATAFAPAAAALTVTSASSAADETSAKAIALNDERLIEAVSAALEGDEAALTAAFSLAAVGPSGRQPAVRLPVQFAKNMPAAAPPIKADTLDTSRLSQLQERRTQARVQQQSFETRQPAYAAEAGRMRQAVVSTPWSTNADDPTTQMRSCEADVALEGGRTRRIQLVRVVGRGASHPLVQARLDMSEPCADGSTKVVRWEKTLQADGAYRVIYHHEIRHPQGHCWVTDWEKNLGLDGRIQGRGSFQVCDKAGKPVKEHPVIIGGDDTDGQVVTAPEASPAPTPTPVPTATPSPATSPEATLEPSPAASESPVVAPPPTPTPTPTPTPCVEGSVTGGGRLADSNLSFGFGPQIITINDVSDSGNDYKADVTRVSVSGTTATITGALRAPRAGTITLVVTDNGEGQAAPDDSVTFLLGSQVIGSGPLTRGNPGGGNVQVRADCD